MATKLTWLSHSTFEVVSGGKTILIDPFFTGNPAARVQASDVAADVIIVTHGHADHIGDTVDIAKRTNALVIANYEIVEWLGRQEVTDVHPMHIGGSHRFDFGTVKLTIAHHGSMLPDGSNGGNPAGFILSTDAGNLYFAGDTGLFYDMKLIGEEGLALAVLPIGDNFTMGPADSIRATKLLQPTYVIPMHYDTWPLIEQNIDEWAHKITSETSAKPVIPTIGEPLEIGD